MRKQILIGVVLTLALAGFYGAYRLVSFTAAIVGELDRSRQLTAIAPRAQATLVMDRHGRPAFSFYSEQRTDVSIDRVSRHMRDAIVAVEDKRFYSHHGLDPVRIAKAAMRNVRAGRIREGGSTITQQLARAAQLSPVRTFDRKIREAMIALRLEERYSKAEILQEYLNTVYFGEGYYGVEAASRGYFAKSAADLDVAEAALLAALVRTPSADAPSVAPDRARRRRDLVLKLMMQQGRISSRDFASAREVPLPRRATGAEAVRASAVTTGGYFQEEIRRHLVSMFGQERVLRGGLRVRSTYDPDLQRAAELAITTRIAEIARARRRARDLQGSLVALDPATGDVLALVGGRSFHESAFNRATQARRQAGSAFKPIIFAAALERGYAPGSLLRDLETPIEGYGEAWLPGGEHEEAEYTLRKALQVSSNRAAAQLLQNVGVSTAVYYAHRLGISSELPQVPSLALGTGEVTLLELTAAYGVFSNRGLLSAPRMITRVEDASGVELWSAPVDARRAISETTAYLMSSMLSDVVSSGTATTARAAGFRLPAGGKTGTTDDYADAWFVGYTPHLVAGVWFGLDTPAPILSRGFAGTVAVPAWARFMKAATTGAKPDWYEVPADVEKVAICRITGARAGDGCRQVITTDIPVEPTISWPPPVRPLPLKAADPPVYEDLFPIGFVPPDICPLHNGGG
jgi:1A family penicillin-binding protein